MDPQGIRGSDILLIALMRANDPDKWRETAPPHDEKANEYMKMLREFRTELEAKAKAQIEKARGNGHSESHPSLGEGQNDTVIETA